MDRLKKMSSKVFKKQSSPLAPLENSKKTNLKHSKSMPFGGPVEPQDLQRPRYRGKGPLKPSDITYVNIPPPIPRIPSFIDITLTDAELHRREQEKKASRDQRDEDGYGSDEEGYGIALDSSTLDKFPTPPHALTTPNSIERLRELRLQAKQREQDELQSHYLRPEDLLPPPDQKLVEYAQQIRDARYGAERRRALQRSVSSASFSRPTRSAYPGMEDTPSLHRRPGTHPPTIHPSYKSSLQSLALPHPPPSPEARLSDGPVSHRPIVQQASQGSIRERPVSHRPVVQQLSHGSLIELGIYHPRVRAAVLGPAERGRQLRTEDEVYASYEDERYAQPSAPAHVIERVRRTSSAHRTHYGYEQPAAPSHGASGYRKTSSKSRSRREDDFQHAF
ncbi:hypothetical protein PLICRDRAFT_172465 [Plicaturopsis crispa FD-325 SS-3]|nr:hypothetical protein PLICRDRAFT_172465 [Plicaturopsis crispa FD-325 SS-3]